MSTEDFSKELAVPHLCEFPLTTHHMMKFLDFREEFEGMTS